MYSKSAYFLPCLCLSLLLYSHGTLAEAYQVRFVDDDNQPVEFAVLANPNISIQPKSIPTEPAIIDQVNMQFSPMVIAVEQGREVSFPNSDNIRHHVYSFSQAKRFETKLYADTPEAPVLFDQAGLVVLGCNIHDSMIGYIFVSPWQDYAISDATGMTTLNTKGPLTELKYWHPWSVLPNQIHTYIVNQWPKDQPLTIKVMIKQPQASSEFNTFKRGFGRQ